MDKVVLPAQNKSLADAIVKDLLKTQRSELSLFLPVGFENFPGPITTVYFLFYFFFPNGIFILGFQFNFSYYISDVPGYDNLNFDLFVVSLQGNYTDLMK